MEYDGCGFMAHKGVRNVSNQNNQICGRIVELARVYFY